MRIGPLPDVLEPVGFSPRQNAVVPGFHGVPASPARPERDADGAGRGLSPGLQELERLAEDLRRSGVAADLHHDPMGPAIVTFRDPDNIQWEFFEQT